MTREKIARFMFGISVMALSFVMSITMAIGVISEIRTIFGPPLPMPRPTAARGQYARSAYIRLLPITKNTTANKGR
jgi:hypothetical protein